jgi:hypothetical protein
MVQVAFGSALAVRRQLAADEQVEAARALLVAHPTAHAVLTLEPPTGDAGAN